MTKKKKWIPIESNPDSLYLYSCKLGQQKLSFVDIYGFNKDLLDMIPKPVHAIIFLYPIKDDIDNSIGSSHINTTNGDINIWFIKQTVSNSCGTIALLHLFANLRNTFPLDKDSVLDTFFTKVDNLKPEGRALEFENNDIIEQLHHEFSGNELNLGESIDVDTHFIVFLEINGMLIELDGRKNHPIIHGQTTSNNFVYDAGKLIQDNFISKYQDCHSFSAIAIVPNNAV
ncbi:ubiquitin carboxyl-terminal hydrolase isozyme L3, putative [Plasmodium berghei]|uniref:Ubiquitin carboxyl-terminal hydrolase n=2 Tax=Plasmodium berghei TaxID=5821 RepID=A0A509ANG8_PLABA|nr:ubiquitin carboxyl-terminal hydrolase isozyme L3, putative [Plasmodium berghei ANKA]CXI94043.1 ubiquitin carboxyl-terminal hydrolase isozyme L3, putative [Plasmodium berghei]SCL96941.1 ubiquitin carboxyl-terminal hydrolase isozyme L3, putative [Plasmodium berghei]SCM16516.1 ubiquitin carboxyl-terminal hydrolase isozyme L3, putative [Plasmodium berghei]SCM18310.1 ubiquitin carboxyl-terminal hydrolase isozyme L3, putative [Plasmodium berghei]SCN27740.1 ubiquitin carboxyl-terminal hydrolase is|eukprot:XP_034423393.1 ubiquitin carboxyl-terminal hydrolase isozyme L3, putative [Plasmodium berghei ANKA]